MISFFFLSFRHKLFFYVTLLPLLMLIDHLFNVLNVAVILCEQSLSLMQALLIYLKIH